MSNSAVMETVLKRDRAVVLTAIVGVVCIAWIYLVILAANMKGTTAMEMMKIQPWSVADFILMFLMWSVMMVGMMIPSSPW